MKKIAGLIAVALLAGCSRANVDDVKAHADQAWKQAGFEIVGYEGYEKGGYLGGDLGGAYVWYTVQRPGDSSVIYHGALQRWGDEYHIYALSALNAISSKQ